MLGESMSGMLTFGEVERGCASLPEKSGMNRS